MTLAEIKDKVAQELGYPWVRTWKEMLNCCSHDKIMLSIDRLAKAYAEAVRTADRKHVADLAEVKILPCGSLAREHCEDYAEVDKSSIIDAPRLILE